MTEFDVIFEKFWSNAPIPAFFKTAIAKEKARIAFSLLLADVGDYLSRPNIVQGVIALNKIGRMLQAARVISQDGYPSPEAVTAAVQQILDRLKKEQPTT